MKKLMGSKPLGMKMMEGAVSITCKTHPTYKAVHPPRTGCHQCWTKYLAIWASHQQNKIDREPLDWI